MYMHIHPSLLQNMIKQGLVLLITFTEKNSSKIPTTNLLENVDIIID